jgi:hypothetical protein
MGGLATTCRSAACLPHEIPHYLFRGMAGVAAAKGARGPLQRGQRHNHLQRNVPGVQTPNAYIIWQFKSSDMCFGFWLMRGGGCTRVVAWQCDCL